MVNRSTKRQKELLEFVDNFIKGQGYGPSYREIMRALGYKSVSTVAVHIDGLIAKGYLRKSDNSARSLEVVSASYGDGSGVGGVAGLGGVNAGFAAGASSTGVASSTGSGAFGGGPKAGADREKWLVSEVEARFIWYKQAGGNQTLDELYVLIGAMKVLGFDKAYKAAKVKLAKIT